MVRSESVPPATGFDAVVIGSGINALVAAARLARGGWRVAVCEREDRPGGAIHTSGEVFPGYTVELLSSWHPLFVGGPAYADLADELARRGVVYRNTTWPTGVACRDGAAALSTDPDALTATLADLGDAENWSAMMTEFGGKIDLAFGVLGADFWRPGALRLLWRALRRLGRRGLVASGAEVLEPSRPWLERTFSSPVTRALLAPWALHGGLGPDDATSAFITKVIAAAVATGGMPVPEGGGVRLVDALAGIVTDAGGELLTGADVTQVVVEQGRARGVRLADGRVLPARRAVLASVTPHALYERLLADGAPADRLKAARAFRHGRAAMQIHLALAEPARWSDPALNDVALVHVLDDLDSLSASVNAAWRGVLPERPTVAVGQPATVDPGRVPEGRGLLWLQLQELPRQVRGDAAGAIDPGDGAWTPRLRDAYADRILDVLRPHITNLDSALTDRLVLGPVELEEMNVNLVGGDPYGGDCRIDQYALWRPLSSGTGHATGVRGLWHIGASTHPGPGLGGGSGFLVTERLLHPRGRR
ncbi:phytoene desaturase family protein [Actinomadura decatromicini]|uniref:Pyridine nucleotide-disulfide oxidoreductase domain-containing protein 2 n=1 Tax=Actinomadura decatromicini TaxID=2604572 RepID=A0A5D3FMK2_9ACTN|nr:NAD(P)/FAD-dependent oxidoreductase [Actinomadura decatromicini]TYK49463.1 NAD(P)/FAD-dependent oxidoreductase [Actinomadura decatromicini]